MVRLLKIVTVLCLLFTIGTEATFSQQIDYKQRNLHYKLLTSGDGLVQNAVHALLQDHHGYLWIGTKNGLSRYDGYNFTTYAHTYKDSTSLPNSYVLKLYQDQQHNLWVSTIDGALSYFDRKENLFYSFYPFKNFGKAPQNHRIRTIAEDKEGWLWIGAENGGLVRFPIDKTIKALKNNTPVPYQFFKKEFIVNHPIHALYRDQNGKMWVSILDKVYMVNLRTGKPAFSLKEQISRQTTQVTEILQTKEGNFWFADTEGLLFYDPVSGIIKRFSHTYPGYTAITAQVRDMSITNKAIWLSTYAKIACFSLKDSTFSYINWQPLPGQPPHLSKSRALLKSKQGGMWIGTNGKGLILYDPKIESFYSYFQDTSVPLQLEGYSLRSILEDSRGNVWVGTYRGLFKLSAGSHSFKQVLEHLEVPARAFLEDDKGHIWIATDWGLIEYNSQTGQTYNHVENLNPNYDYVKNNIQAIARDKEGSLWLLTYGSLHQYNPETGSTKSWAWPTSKPLEADPIPKMILIQGNKTLWFTTNEGFFRFDRKSHTFEQFNTEKYARSGLRSDRVNTLLIDPNDENILWIATTGGGLIRMNIEQKTFKAFTQSDGLPDNVVYAVLPDKQGRLWISTNKGLARFNPDTKNTLIFNIHNSLIQANEFNTGAWYQNEEGVIFFGGINGINAFDPGVFDISRYQPNMLVTDIEVMDHDLTPENANNPFSPAIGMIDSLSLPHDKNYFAIEFAALNLSNPLSQHYSYRLLPRNQEWIDLNTSRRVSLANLAPGSYTFQVRTAGIDKQWSEPLLSVSIHIAPPWWTTTWAFFGYFIFGFMVIAAIIRYRNRAMHQRQTELKQKVAERTTQLRNKTQTLKKQSEKLQEMDKLKSRFFANISHEFRTPLTLILAQTDDEKADGKDSKKHSIIRKNANRLLALINKLLDLSQIDSKKMTLRPKAIDPAELISMWVRSFKSLAQQKNVSVNYQQPIHEFQYLLDEEKLEEIIINLIANALKFTPGGGTINITLHFDECEKKSHDLLRFSVQDTGIGIAADQLAHIFDRFHQTSGTKGGTGIGLALVKEFTALMDGEIVVESKPGEGTEFTVEIPVYRIAAKKDGQSTEVQEHEPSKKPTQTGATILVIEDQQDLREYIAQIFTPSYTVLQAGDGKEGWQKACEEIPDLVISDVMMPNMDGYDLCEKLKTDQRTSHIPIILLTAKAAPENKLEGLGYGADDYLVKPFDRKELIERTRNLIHTRKELRRKFSLEPGYSAQNDGTESAFATKLRKILENNLDDEGFDVKALSKKLNLSRSQLYRKLKAVSGKTPTRLILDFRLDKAAALLRNEELTVSEIAYQTGFKTSSYFSTAFKRKFDASPTTYREKIK